MFRSLVDAAFDWEQVFDHFRNSVGCTYKMDFDCLALCASKATVSVLSRHPALGRLFANPYKRQLLNILECCPHLDTGVLEVLQSAAYTDSDASRTVTDRVPCPAAADVVTSKVTRGKAVSSPCVPQTVLVHRGRTHCLLHARRPRAICPVPTPFSMVKYLRHLFLGEREYE